MLLASCPIDGRKLRYVINGLLKSGLAQEIKRINYVKSYHLVEKTIEKKEEKLLLIIGLDNEKIKQFIQKQRPEVTFLPGL